MKKRIFHTPKGSKVKRLILTINPHGAISARAPKGISIHTIENFVLGKSKWIFRRLSYFSQYHIDTRILKSSRKNYIHNNKEAARRLVHEKIEHFNSVYNFTIGRVSIKDTKTRWGSCSSKGNLNFNYKRVFLPDDLVEYIVVHELCHLKEFNHSQDFWNMVSIAIPDYTIRKIKLKHIKSL